MVKLDDIETKLKHVQRNLELAKVLREEAAVLLATAWKNTPDGKRRDIEEARNRLANASVSLILIERTLKEIMC
jgi:hypothetical protein